MLQHKEPPIQ